MKKLLSITLSIALLLGLFPTSAGAAEARPVDEVERPVEVMEAPLGKDIAAEVPALPVDPPADSDEFPAQLAEGARTVVASGSCGANVTWTFYSDGELHISGTGNMAYYSSSSSVPWFANYRDQIISVAIDSGVTSIAYYAFDGCSSLASVNIPEGVTEIGDLAFYGCSSLTSVTLPNSLTSIGGNYYHGGTFQNCSSLTSITIPGGVTSIELNAFSGCSALTSITIPDSVTSIREDAFYGCSKLTTAGPIGSGCNIEFGWTTQIPANAFSGCTSLTSITIPDSVTSIRDRAFDDCSALTSVVIPEGVTSIGYYAFSGCSSLPSVNIPEGVTKIGSFAFSGCSSLTKIEVAQGNSCYASLDGVLFNKDRTTLEAYPSGKTGDYIIPESVTSIGDRAFFGCSVLTSVNIPKGVTEIGPSAFSGCTSLTSITIPDSVTSIGYRAFDGCSALSSITIPGSVTSIGSSAFSGCLSLTTAGPIGSGCNIEFGWTPQIPSDAFYGCSTLTSITIPDSVTSIGEDAFSGCSKLTTAGPIGSGCNIEFGWTTQIPANAFSGCTSLTGITIPDSVTSIGEGAFSSCSKLTTAGPIGSGCNIEFGWTADIPSNIFGRFPSLMRVTIPESITSIGYRAFDGCSKLTTAGPIGSGCNIEFGWATQIPASAFSGCSALTSVIIPEGVTEIGNSAFNGCSALTTVTIPEGVTSIGPWAFDECSALTSITIPHSVTSIGSFAFSDCSKLATAGPIGSGCNIEFGWTTQIPANAFENFSALTSIVIPDSVTSIGDRAFSNCSALTSITIPSGVTSIEDWTFGNCTSLTSITIPNSVTSIGTFAFSDCSKLTSVYYAGTKRQWESASDSEVKSRIPGKAEVTVLLYEINYAPGEATGEMETQIAKKDVAFTLPACTFTPPSEMIFKAWRLDGREYAPGAKVLMTDDTTVTAVWKTCEHRFSVVENITTPPTCGAAGSKDVTRTCDVCGYVTTSVETIPATGLHTYAKTDESVTLEPTCVDTGKRKNTFTCGVCGHSYTEDETIPATGLHTYTQTGEEVTLEPTCVETGIREYTFTCGVCNHSYTEQETIPATGVHDFTLLEEKVITPETCKNEGLKRVTTLCTMCGERRSHDEVLPIVDHTYGPFVILTAPSGSTAGTGEKTCTVCGDTVAVTLCQIIYNAWGSATTMDSRVVEANTLFTLPACSLTGPEGQRFQGWALLGDLYSPGDQVTVTENLVLTPRWAYETVDVPFTTQSYPNTVTIYRGQPVRAELPGNDIVTSYTVFDEGQTKLFSNTYHMWTEDTSLGNFIPDQPGTYTLQYTLSRYTETTMNVDGTMQTVKRPTGEPETYTRTIVVRVPAASFSCAAQSDGSILLRIERNRFPGSGTVYLASYSTNGQLLELKSLSIADLSQGCSRAVAIKTERGGYYKAFLLNSDSGSPLAEAVVGTDL